MADRRQQLEKVWYDLPHPDPYGPNGACEPRFVLSMQTSKPFISLTVLAMGPALETRDHRIGDPILSMDYYGDLHQHMVQQDMYPLGSFTVYAFASMLFWHRGQTLSLQHFQNHKNHGCKSLGRKVLLAGLQFCVNTLMIPPTTRFALTAATSGNQMPLIRFYQNHLGLEVEHENPDIQDALNERHPSLHVQKMQNAVGCTEYFRCVAMCGTVGTTIAAIEKSLANLRG